jgi:hypothetical protein
MSGAQLDRGGERQFHGPDSDAEGALGDRLGGNAQDGEPIRHGNFNWWWRRARDAAGQERSIRSTTCGTPSPRR